MSGPHIPDKYTVTLAGGADMDLDNIHIKELPTVTLSMQGLDNIRIKELPKVESSLAVTQLPKVDASLAVTQLPKIDASLAITQLPKIDADIGLKPTRIHMPMHTQICLSFLGINLLKLSICGENMMIAEPYVPHRAERCE
jgi:hypothetical protein